MKTSQYAGASLGPPRSHPWTDAVSSAAHRYCDFKTTPAAIRTSLEDFVPWQNYSAVEQFYELLEWLNAPGCALESNDCEFTTPHANEAPEFPAALQCSGRVMVLFRALDENCERDRVDALEGALHRHLGARDETFEWGVIGTAVVPVRYVTLPRDAQLGHQLMISFWAWGNTESYVMENLARVVGNLSHALRAVTAEDRAST